MPSACLHGLARNFKIEPTEQNWTEMLARSLDHIIILTALVH
jgi:hypothetical protein